MLKFLARRFVKNLIKDKTGWEIKNPHKVDTAAKPHVVFMYPHTTNWDGVFAAFLPLLQGTRTIIMVKDDWDLPFLGKFAEKAGFHFINRDDPDMDSLKKRVIREKASIAIAPEGTRAKAKKIKKGFYFLAKELDIDILPVNADYKNKSFNIHAPISIRDKDTGKYRRLSDIMKELKATYEPHMGNSFVPERETELK